MRIFFSQIFFTASKRPFFSIRDVGLEQLGELVWNILFGYNTQFNK